MPSVRMVVIEFEGEIWLHEGPDPWHFITLPVEASDVLREQFPGPVRGFGSIPVHVKIGLTEWRTSVFPDKKSGSLLLPVKAAIRKAEDLSEGDRALVRIENA